MNAPVLLARGISKKFRIFSYKPATFQERLLLRKSRYQDLWALKNVSFEVPKGQVLGIIGRNGSGKSTLLRIFSRIYRPTEGQIEVRGRISSLIEMGAGFHPELTGRENIFLNGSILGMTRKEIEKKIERIIIFSELGDFIDSPIKTYSMGMFLRLAFATAIQVDPDILIIDELIGVGDISFQEKSVGQILKLKDSGRTILLVSHHMALIRHLSDRVLWLERGEVKGLGEPGAVIASYMEHLKVSGVRMEEVRGPGGVPITRRRWGEGKIRIEKVSFLGSDGTERFLFHPGETVRIRCLLHTPEPVKGLGLTLQIHLADGNPLDGPRLFKSDRPFQGTGTVDFVFDQLPFVRSSFMVSVSVYDRENPVIPSDSHERLYEFSVLDEGDVDALGFLKLPGRWEAHLELP